MLKLGVNIDHVATLREARYRGKTSGEPDVIEAARVCEAAGAHGITVHLREDRRHIQDRDFRELRKTVRTTLNLEMANAPEIVAIALQLKPDFVCMVPERRQEVTTEGGLDVAGSVPDLTDTCRKMSQAGIKVSMFIGPDIRQVEASAQVGAQIVELHTGAFAEHFNDAATRQVEIDRLRKAAARAHEVGLQVNAGHGLNYTNVPALKPVPHLVDLNIGHSIVSRAIFIGLETAVRKMLAVMKKLQG
jgi:pyridoxine 5-phosphate synthase